MCKILLQEAQPVQPSTSGLSGRRTAAQSFRPRSMCLKRPQKLDSCILPQWLSILRATRSSFMTPRWVRFPRFLTFSCPLRKMAPVFSRQSISPKPAEVIHQPLPRILPSPSIRWATLMRSIAGKISRQASATSISPGQLMEALIFLSRLMPHTQRIWVFTCWLLPLGQTEAETLALPGRHSRQV